MKSRQPDKNVLPHQVTLWNFVESSVVNGAPEDRYQKSYIRYVRVDFTKRSNVLMTGSEDAASLLLLIFNGVSEVTDGEGNLRTFIPAFKFLSASEEERKKKWTLNDGNDYVSLGFVQEDELSKGGEMSRRDYKITIVDPKYGMNGIHHWEATGA